MHANWIESLRQGGLTITDTKAHTGADAHDPHTPPSDWYTELALWAAGRRVLWVGADDAWPLHLLAAMGAQVSVADDRPAPLADAAQRVPRPDLAFELAALTALPYAPAHFDAIVMARRAPEADLPEARRELARVLAPGGRLVWLGPAGPANPAVPGWAHRIDGPARPVSWILMTQAPVSAPHWPASASAPAAALDRLARELEARTAAWHALDLEARRLQRDNVMLAAAAVRVGVLERERGRLEDAHRTLQGVARRIDEAVAEAARLAAEVDAWRARYEAVQAENRAVWAEHHTLAARSDRLAVIEASRAWALTSRYWRALDHSPMRGVLRAGRRAALWATGRSSRRSGQDPQ